MLGEGEKMELLGPRRKRRDTKKGEFGLEIIAWGGGVEQDRGS